MAHRLFREAMDARRLHEDLHAGLMLAVHDRGEQAAALLVFAGIRDRLGAGPSTCAIRYGRVMTEAPKQRPAPTRMYMQSRRRISLPCSRESSNAIVDTWRLRMMAGILVWQWSSP